eukprot:GHVS01086136.1.p1 GENE.GHVS01086136.1~~GHVS01086136.1.p1  ORF type:complete len:212 (+),score=40.97 GHVS01086136.1:926-1561(+)
MPSPSSMRTIEESQEETMEEHRLKQITKPELPDYQIRKVVNLYSEAELMRNLADYISDLLLALDYTEDYTFTNLRILLTGLSCLFALYATAVVSFPDQILQLKYSVLAFFGVLGVLFVIEATTVKSAIIAIRNKKGDRLFIDGHLDRSEGQVVFGIRASNKTELTRAPYVGLFFDKNGMLVTDAIFDEMRQLLLDHESGKRDDQVNKKKLK